MNALDILLLGTGAIVLVLSLVAGFIVNRAWVSEVVICLAAGAVLGQLLNFFYKQELFGGDRFWTLEQVTWITLGIAVMGVALRVPMDFLRRYRRDVVIVLGLGMPLMWLTGAVLSWAILGLSILPALLIGAILAPTDPVVSQSIISGQVTEKHVPECVRNILLVESGANDGLGALFVMLPILVLQMPLGEALGEWATRTLLWEVLASIGFGAVVGWAAAKLFRWARRQDYAEKQPLLAIALALSVTVLAGVQLIGSDGILAVFVAGLMFNRGTADVETQQGLFHNTVTRFFDLPAFVLIGVLLPWSDWVAMGWPLVALGVAVLAVRRMPWWWLLSPLVRSLRTRPEVLFAGWFGPIGVAAAYYAMLAHRETHLEMLWPIASFVITLSVAAHGITATPLAQTLGAKLQQMQDRDETEPTGSEDAA